MRSACDLIAVLAARVAVLAGALALPAPAHACPSTASYRSVVLNHPPSGIPADARLYRVRVDEAYRTNREPYVEGIRGALLERDGAPATQVFEIRARLDSMCDTWVEQWTGDHEVVDGTLLGYIVARPIGMIGERVVLWPMLWRSAADRAAVDGRNVKSVHGVWLHQRVREHGADMRRYRVRGDGRWTPMKVDAEALGRQLEETNRLIREGLEERAEAGE